MGRGDGGDGGEVLGEEEQGAHIYRMGTFCPGSWLHLGQKVFLGEPGKFPARGPPLVPSGSTTGTKGARFPSFPPNLMFVFVSFYFSFKIGFNLLIQLINFDSKNYGTKFLISI